MDEKELKTYLMRLFALESFVIGNLVMIDKYLSQQDPLSAIMFHDFVTAGRMILEDECMTEVEKYFDEEDTK